MGRIKAVSRLPQYLTEISACISEVKDGGIDTLDTGDIDRSGHRGLIDHDATMNSSD